MRSFLIRLVSLLLASSLLICLACVTPFPIEKLEEGMTAETVRESFGEPVAANLVWDPPGGWGLLRGVWTYDAESSLTYVHEERANVAGSVILSSFLLPIQIAASAIGALIDYGDFQWDWAYVERRPVVLHFGQEQLVRWEVIEPFWTVPDVRLEGGMDSLHHAAGHDHHHGH
jgi:hypothetical protein